MASLLDIAPLVETVDVRGTKIEVGGVSAAGIISLLMRFPELRQVISGRTPDLTRLLEMGGDVVGAVIAAGCGTPGVVEFEEKAGSLPVGDQTVLLSAIIKVSLPNGIAPVLQLAGMLSGGEASNTALATKSRKRSPG